MTTDAHSSSRFDLPPRFHNSLSYSLTAIIMFVLADWRRPEVALVAGLWVAHFVRRTFESLFVHRYSGRPVPIADWAVEYVYYWGFAVWIALGVGADSWSPVTGPVLYVGLSIFALGELGNTWAHLKLRSLRGELGEGTRKIPHGGLFEFVSCPHYLFEITSWVGFACVTQVWGALGFLGLGAGILGTYSWQRHGAYRRQFDGADGASRYPESRKALIPFVF